MSGNDLAFVRETMRLLEDAGIRAWLFGGWAEELPPSLPAGSFCERRQGLRRRQAGPSPLASRIGRSRLDT